MSMSPLATSIRDAYEAIAAKLNGSAAMPFHAVRAHALEQFVNVGIPTVRHEEWKYTNVMPLAAKSWSHTPTVWNGWSDREPVPSLEGLHQALVVEVRNGAVTLIGNGTLPDGVVIAPLSTCDVSDTNAQRLQEHPFAAAAIALASEGIMIDVADNVECPLTIHIAVHGEAVEQDQLLATRVLIRAGRNAKLDVVESHHTRGSKHVLDLHVCSVMLAEGARVSYVKMLDDTERLHHVGQVVADVGRNACFASHSVNLNAGFVRNDVQVRLVGEQSEGYLYGMSVLDATQYVDNHTVVDHAVPHCHSEELYKGVYNGSSTGVFNGKIYVRPQAQKTTAYQSSHSLLLSGKAQVNAKPQLEIWADDVKCSHGATTGQLNEDAVFYLQARGIERAKAVALLTYAFAAEVIEKLPHENLRTNVLDRLAEKLGAAGL